MSEKNSGGKKTPAILGIIAAVIAAFFGITIPTNFFGGGNENTSSVPTSSKVESVNSSVNEESSKAEIMVTSKPETTTKKQETSKPETTTTKTETSKPETTTTKKQETSKPESSKEEVFYYFRNQGLYDSHYEKHGHEFGNITKEEYLQRANDLINSDSPDVLTKYEDDGDFMYFDKKSGEFLVLSPDGYIRTFFIPDDGIDYWNRQ